MIQKNMVTALNVKQALKQYCSPTIISCHFHIDTFEVTADRLAKVLAEDSHHGAGQKDDNAALVEELEHPVVDCRLVKVAVLANVTQQVRHLLKFLFFHFLLKNRLHGVGLYLTFKLKRHHFFTEGF